MHVLWRYLHVNRSLVNDCGQIISDNTLFCQKILMADCSALYCPD